VVLHSGREKLQIVHKTEPAELQAANEVIIVKLLTPKKAKEEKQERDTSTNSKSKQLTIPKKIASKRRLDLREPENNKREHKSTFSP
jgi:hypothetical protein